MIIDIHTHAWPDKVAAKARENLEAVFKVKLVGEPTLTTLLKFMDQNRIDISVICAVATKPEQVPSINDWLVSVKSLRIKVFGALHPDYPYWREELLRLGHSLDGIKLQPEFQDFYVDEERMLVVYDTMQALGLPVLFHCGEELSGTMLVRSSPERLIKVKERFSNLKIIAAHFGGFRLWEEVEKYLLGRDIYLDTAFFFDQMPQEKIRDLILRHPQDRLLFGTDFPLVDQKKDLDYLEGLDLAEGLKERILYRNAQQLLGI